MSSASSDNDDFVMVNLSPSGSTSPQSSPPRSPRDSSQDSDYEEEDYTISQMITTPVTTTTKDTLLKNNYKHLPYGDYSPISIIEGVDSQEEGVLQLLSVRTLKDLAEYDSAETFIDACDMIPELCVLVSRAKALRDALRQHCGSLVTDNVNPPVLVEPPRTAPMHVALPVTTPPLAVSNQNPLPTNVATKHVKTEEQKTTLWVYHYVSEAVYQQIKDERWLKSAYVLFADYMGCQRAQRPFHAWKRVHHAYLRDTARWMNKKNVDLSQITDADVYTFLVWRASFSFGKSDCTAGPKAIYFSWVAMPSEVRENAVMIDQVLAEDTRDPFADRFSRVIKIDLRKLHTLHNAKIYRVEASKQSDTQLDSNHWLPTTIGEVLDIKNTPASQIWRHFEPGESYFNCVPHGCVVLNDGSIPFDCIKLEEDRE